MKPFHTLTIMIAIMAMVASAPAQEPTSEDAAKDKTTASKTSGTGKHLFILSGQSNMYHMPADEFGAVVAKEFGKENVTIAASAKRGAAIRFWDKDYPWPEDRNVPQGRARRKSGEKITREEYLARFGELYKGMWASVEKSAKGKTFDTVTFVWMQGESDSNRDPDVYFKSFDRVVARLKGDLNIESMNIVIGRISDKGMNQETWVTFREGQVKYAEAHSNCEWIDTDDLNDKKKDDGTTVNDLHYTKEGYKILAKRFAEKAVALIKQNNAGASHNQ